MWSSVLHQIVWRYGRVCFTLPFICSPFVHLQPYFWKHMHGTDEQIAKANKCLIVGLEIREKLLSVDDGIRALPWWRRVHWTRGVHGLEHLVELSPRQLHPHHTEHGECLTSIRTTGQCPAHIMLSNCNSINHNHKTCGYRAIPKPENSVAAKHSTRASHQPMKTLFVGQKME